MSVESKVEPVLITGREGGRVLVCRQGAHITSWTSAEGVERLFLSSLAEFAPNVAIRGGVPIIFPQFAALGPLPKHGFARTVAWEHQQSSQSVTDELESATFVLRSSAATLAMWPYRFMAQYRVTLREHGLEMHLQIGNEDAQAFSFTAALHTYLRVTNIDNVVVSGLQGIRYRDSTASGRECVDADEHLHFNGEVDRIYFSTPRPIRVSEPDRPGILCSAKGFEDTVIWNPGPELSRKLPDMEPDGYRRMVCVEAAQIGAPVVLQPGESWQGSQTLTIE